jgi:hypothetical protein
VEFFKFPSGAGNPDHRPRLTLDFSQASCVRDNIDGMLLLYVVRTVCLGPVSLLTLSMMESLVEEARGE